VEGWRGVVLFGPLGYGERVGEDGAGGESDGGDCVDFLAGWGEGWWGGAAMGVSWDVVEGEGGGDGH
jgi:hypothetical protein